MPSDSAFSRFLIRSLVILALVNGGGLWVVNWWHYHQFDQFRQQFEVNRSEHDGREDQLGSDQPTQLSSQPSMALQESLDQRVAQLEQTIKQSTAAPAMLPSTPAQQVSRSQPSGLSKPQPQEIILYLGAGSTTSRNWTDIDAAALTINPDVYGEQTTMQFEAALSIAGGEAQARLVNKTTGAILNLTEISHNTDHTTWKTAPPLPLTRGTATYGLQLRSTSGEWAYVSGSRVRLSETH